MRVGDSTMRRAQSGRMTDMFDRVVPLVLSRTHAVPAQSHGVVCLRMLDDTVPGTYGPTADVTGSGRTPTTTLDAARRAGA